MAPVVERRTLLGWLEERQGERARARTGAEPETRVREDDDGGALTAVRGDEEIEMALRFTEPAPGAETKTRGDDDVQDRGLFFDQTSEAEDPETAVRGDEPVTETRGDEDE